jgi:hypothetical protein
MITLLPPAVNDCQRALTFVRSERGTTILGPNDGEDWASYHQLKVGEGVLGRRDVLGS